MTESDKVMLNVAATLVGTSVLGPGLRAVVWVQGCPLRCPGCLAPDWIPFTPARLVAPEVLADELLAHPLISGLTFSGGEPTAQAEGLAQLARLARQRRRMDIICFSGFTLERLRQSPPYPGVADLLAQVDVLIDGAYIAQQDDNRGLRGSANQRIHHLTHRLAGVDLQSAPRRAEVVVRDGHLMLVGVPPTGLLASVSQAAG